MPTITCTTKRSDDPDVLVQWPESIMDVIDWLIRGDFKDGAQLSEVMVEGDTAVVVLRTVKPDHEVSTAYTGLREEMALPLQVAYSHLLLTKQPGSPVSQVEEQAAMAVSDAAALAELSRLWDDVDMTQRLYLMLLGRAEEHLKYRSTDSIVSELLSVHEELQEV